MTLAQKAILDFYRIEHLENNDGLMATLRRVMSDPFYAQELAKVLELPIS